MNFANTITNDSSYYASDFQTNYPKAVVPFAEKCAFMKERFGRHIDETTPIYTHFEMSKASQVFDFGGYWQTLEFARDGFGNHEKALENTAKEYAELREKIFEMFKDDEDEKYRQLGELNRAFELVLRNASLMGGHSPKSSGSSGITIYYHSTESERIQGERETARRTEATERYDESMRNFYSNLQSNMYRHMDTFYCNFISKIQTQDFDTAFKDSMALLAESKTTSINQISYRDLIEIRETTANTAIKFDQETGRPLTYRYSSKEDALWAVINNKNISNIIREGLSEILRGKII